jgi:hypothetical protein
MTLSMSIVATCTAVRVSDALFSAPDARPFFLLSCQEKEGKEKARPVRRRSLCERSPALLGRGGGCGTRPCGAQTVLALFPPRPRLLGASQGLNCVADRPPKISGSVRCALPAHLSRRAAERCPGIRRGLSESSRSEGEFRSRRARRAAQGIRFAASSRSERRGGSPFLSPFSFGETKEMGPRVKRGTQRLSKHTRLMRNTEPSKHLPTEFRPLEA